MSFEFVSLNIAYALYLAATVPREITRLRMVLVVASVGFIIYGVAAGIVTVVVWNALFGALNLYQLLVIFRQRRNLDASDEALEVRDRLFPTMPLYDFCFLWNLGESAEVARDQLTTQGEPNATLFLVLDGQLHAERDGVRVASRSTFGIFGEQSLLTGQPASADIVVDESARLRQWPHEKLDALQQLKPEIYSAVISVLGREMSTKINPI